MPAKKQRKRRIRLSFIGGRRPASLPPAIKKVKGNVIVEKGNSQRDTENVEHVEHTNNEDCIDVVQPSVNPVESKKEPNLPFNMTYEVSLNSPTDLKNLVLNSTKNITNQQISTTKKVLNDISQITASSSKDVGEETQVTKSGRKTRSNRRMTIEQLQTKSENELKSDNSETQNKKEKLLLELQKWKEVLMSKQTIPATTTDIKLPCELEVNFNDELEDIQLYYDQWIANVDEVNVLETKLNTMQQIVSKKLEMQRNEIQFNSTNVVDMDETPRTLMKKIIHGK